MRSFLVALLLVALSDSLALLLSTKLQAVLSRRPFSLSLSATELTSSHPSSTLTAVPPPSEELRAEAEIILRILLSRRSSVEQKASTYEPLRKLRQNQDPASTARYLDILKQIFEIMSSVEDNKWCAKRLPLMIPERPWKVFGNPSGGPWELGCKTQYVPPSILLALYHYLLL